ncbi:MAG: hypothetical protein CBC55_05045 [Gammaproteobacteria bacterium TMED95]|nr:MAG: hypothetical protein CBC55_05045 [Gammaproteobacteria bacterium TMED95]|tara:strand:+ start:10614 stop:13088 length:2475 start_codon:yes stop_codon:yes gene_type:complete
MQMKGLISLGLICAAMPTLAQEESIMDFDLDTSYWEEFTDGWRYARTNDQQCDYLASQSKLCKGSHRFYMYYNGHNNDHIGWMRYGYFAPTSELSVSGNALRIVYTGGAKSDGNNGVEQHGMPVYGYYDFLEAYSQNGDDVFSNVSLPGTPTLYYQDHFSGTTSLGIYDDANRFTVNTWSPREANPYLQREKANADLIRPSRTLAWYPFIDSARSSHYYHHVSNRAFGGWVKAEFDGNPTHSNAGVSNPNGSLPEGGTHYPYDAYSYFENVASFAVRFLGAANSDSPYSIVTDDWKKSEVLYENDYTISSLGVGYDPVTGNFDISFEDKYRCADCNAKYEVKYSFNPINTGNFDLAKDFDAVKNFYIEDDNEDGLIIKAKAGYNQNWAYLVLPYEDAVRFKSGESIYFAVKDVSERTFDYDVKDDEVVTTPWGDFRKRDLVRTLSFDYQETSLTLEDNGDRTQYSPIGGQIGINIQTDFGGNSIAFKGNPPLYDIAPYAEGLSFNLFDGDSGEGYCGVDLECNTYELANIESAELGYSEFSSFNEKSIELARENVDGQIIGSPELHDQYSISGKGFSLLPSDSITFTVKNTATRTVHVTPRVTSYIQGRPDLMNSSRYYQETKLVAKNGEESWTVPATDFAGASLSAILLNVPQSEDVKITSIKLNTTQEMTCFMCGDLLVDYYEGGGSVHNFGIDGWNNVVSDSYTKKVGDGYSIAVGSNGGYDYVAISGESSLTGNTAMARVVWMNISEQTYEFTPTYNLQEVGRRNATTTPWQESETITVAPGESAEQFIPIDASTRVINVNVGVNNPGHLVLDKILISGN